MASGNGDRTQCTASTLDEKSAIRRGASAALACRGRVTGKSKAIPKSVACAQVRRSVTDRQRSGSNLKTNWDDPGCKSCWIHANQLDELLPPGRQSHNPFSLSGY